MKSPEAALTGNDVSGSHKTGSDRVRIHNRFLCFFLSLVVVQNVPLRVTGSSMATVCAMEGWGACKRNRKWHNIRPSGAFSPEVTSSNITMRNRKFCNIRSNVTSRASTGKYGSTHAQSQVPFGCSLGYLGHITLSFSTN